MMQTLRSFGAEAPHIDSLAGGHEDYTAPLGGTRPPDAAAAMSRPLRAKDTPAYQKMPAGGCGGIDRLSPV